MTQFSGIIRRDGENNGFRVHNDANEHRPLPIKPRMLAPGTTLESLEDGMRVEYQQHKGQPRGLRPEGAQEPISRTEFTNPYVYIPSNPLEGQHRELRDSSPAGHHRLLPDRWTGRIGVTLTAFTPLLLLDTSRAQTDDSGHTTYPVLMRDGAPHLPTTSVKGMLRAAYEAGVCDRFGVFTGHEYRLGRRMQAEEAKRMVPARISDDGLQIELLPGTTKVGEQPKPGSVQHAAWLPQYRRGQPTSEEELTLRYEDDRPPQHGDHVEADVELRKHRRNFWYWQVQNHSGALRQIGPEAAAHRQPPPVPASGSVDETRTIRGWVFISNQNAPQKHNERIFFSDLPSPETRPLTRALSAEWEEVIRNYRAAHRSSDIWKRQGNANPWDFLSATPGQTAWSRHQYLEEYERLGPGSLCYAQVSARGEVTGLYPVMIARGLFAKAPAALLDNSLRPARNLGELSPADRVFGWTADSGAGAYRGHLRIRPVACDTPTAEAVEHFPAPGLPLAVLGEPKPQQHRFYLDGSKTEGHSPNGSDARGPYTEGQSLKGRKVYPHHRDLPQDHWENPLQDRTQTPAPTGHHQEYRRPSGERERDSQNSSVLGWVRPGANFQLTLDVENLTDFELGALMWLLTLDEGHYLRLGHGKPLGFGSVRAVLDPEHTAVHQGEHWRERYRRVTPSPDRTHTTEGSGGSPTALATRLAEAFEEAMSDPSQLRRANPLEAFRATARGYKGFAVHYPRMRGDDTPPGPDPDGGSYEWFSENERKEEKERNGRNGRKGPARQRSLPSWDKPQLPFYDKVSRRGKNEERS